MKVQASNGRLDPVPESEWDEEMRDLVTRSWSGGRTDDPQNLFRTFLHHPELFRVWSSFGARVLHGKLPDRDRELIILRVAWHTQAVFEWAFHERVARDAGITTEEIEAIVDGPDAPNWSARDAALIRAADELRATTVFTDETWDELAEHYDHEQLIEIPTVVGQYTMVAYITNSLRIAPPAGKPALPKR